MKPIEQWIWLPCAQYPGAQKSRYTVLAERKDADGYAAAAFFRTYALGKSVKRMKLRFSGDAVYRLYASGTEVPGTDHLLARGPASAGGDFLFNDRPRQNCYADTLILSAEETPELANLLAGGTVAFYAEVQLQPGRMFEFSRGHGGFMLTADVTFSDGTKTVLLTDGTWNARRLDCYTGIGAYDGRNAASPVCRAEIVDNIWSCEDSPIPPCAAETRIPDGAEQPLVIPAGETKDFDLPLDKIYACYPEAAAKVEDGELRVTLRCYETGADGEPETCIFTKDGNAYRSFALRSAGGVRVRAENTGSAPAELSVSVTASHYPAPRRAVTTTSDPDLDLVTEVCAHTLKYCRQTLHLDSPRHCEPMACTGDYFIESLMTAFTFGDMRLAAFDVRRTAELLRYHDGRMFHTSYSLIWVQMLWDTYMLTGEKALLTDCEQALTMLLARFETYIGDTGLIETPPDYMFIDWLNPDGISMHHPPKALGQTCLCLYYFGALEYASFVYAAIGEDAMSQKAARDAQTLRRAILTHLYDPERGLFFEGLNTPTPEHLLANYMPQNTDKRYYRRHANILAAYFGIMGGEADRAILRRIWKDETLGPVQPYFMHFWLEAIFRCGLCGEMTLPLLELWKEPVRECAKGLAEGFYKPEPTYSFDHSHAWGGTPAYALPRALSGIRFLAPGYERIRLDPQLCGLEEAHVEIPAPQGMIVIDMKAGEEPVVTVPDGIEVIH